MHACLSYSLLFLFYFICLFFFFLMIRRPPRSTLFPYRRSSDLLGWRGEFCAEPVCLELREPSQIAATNASWKTDRKSTRLNSSHVEISYAVFCLKKKKTQPNRHHHGTTYSRRPTREAT